MRNLLSTLPLAKTTRKTLEQWLIMLAAILMVAVIEHFGLSNTLLLPVRNLSAPLLQVNVQMASAVSKWGRLLHQQQQLARRVQSLEIRLSHSLAQLGEIDQLREENQELRRLLNSSDRSLGRVVLTRPILSFAQPVISLPANEEILQGSAVLVENTLVGQIKEVKKDVAVVELLWQNSSTPVLATAESGAQGVVVGDGRRVLLTEIPIDEPLEVGQRITTSGQQGIQQGLFIGEVRSLETGDSAAVKTAVLEQFVSFYETQLVEIRL